MTHRDLTVEKIRTGNSNIRNPILVSYVAKGLLPYHGLGSGIKRALAEWSAIDFTDDRDGDLFTAIVYRKPIEQHQLVNQIFEEPEQLEPVSVIRQDSIRTVSGKCRDNVGKDSGCLSGKTIHHYHAVSRTNRHH